MCRKFLKGNLLKLYNILTGSLVGIVLSGCQPYLHHRYHDPDLKTTPEVYDKLTQDQFWEGPQSLPPKPFSLPVVFPSGFQKPVSLVALDGVPLKEALIALGGQADVNLVIDSSIEGQAQVSFQEEPFGRALDALCQSHRLRFRLNHGTLIVEPDTPYVKTYALNFFSGHRKTETRMALATDVFSAAAQDQGAHLSDIDNGSHTLITASTKTDFWESVHQNIQLILNSQKISKSEDFTQISLSPGSGTISIRGKNADHRAVESYLRMLKVIMGAQVLIEAKILEVSLLDEFQSGINWSRLQGDFNFKAGLGPSAVITPGTVQLSENPPQDVIRLGSRGQNLQTFLGILSRFGTVRTLSSPRLTVMNHQTAVMKVATNEVFFRVDYTREPTTQNTPGIERAFSQIQTVPIGFLMVVHPALDPETGKIILSLRPTLSKVDTRKKDPATALLTNQQITSEVPEVRVREMETLITLNSGETAVLGGLMEEKSANIRTGLPEAGKIPVVGPLLNGKDDRREVTELVIFLRATILADPTESLAPADQEIYQAFAHDPRRIA